MEQAISFTAERSFSLRALPYQPRSMDEVAARLVQHAHGSGPTHLVIPVNGQVFVLGHQKPEFADVILRAEEVVLDGISVVSGVRMLGDKSVHRVPGVDLMMSICEHASTQPTRIMLLGGKPGAGEKMRELLRQRYPLLEVGVHCPPMGFDKTPEGIHAVREAISEFAPQILFAAFGAPRQEMFMDRQIRSLNVPVAMAVGGSFEMVSGMVRRAPEWIRNLGMEWFFRMVIEPRRLLWRYVYTNTVFLWIFGREWLETRLAANSR